MPAWDRQTLWRQGHALTNEAAQKLGLVTTGKAEVAIVISHDCDIAQSPVLEPYIETIVGRRIAAANGNFTHAKNPRRLHLRFKEKDADIYLDLQAREKQSILKDTFAPYSPDKAITLTAQGRSILQRWLAARYRRSAFPDEFGSRLQKTGLDKRVARIIEPLGMHLIAIFFDVDEDNGVERIGANDPYRLEIVLLYSTEEDPIAARQAAEEAVHTISGAFREQCFVTGEGWRDIELVGCESISDEAMTYAMSVQLKRWNTDYISFRSESVNEPMHRE
jgi:hypothetical protein